MTIVFSTENGLFLKHGISNDIVSVDNLVDGASSVCISPDSSRVLITHLRYDEENTIDIYIVCLSTGKCRMALKKQCNNSNIQWYDDKSVVVDNCLSYLDHRGPTELAPSGTYVLPRPFEELLIKSAAKLK
jgi:hypothetical protein